MTSSRYYSYLLRLWESRDGEELSWRASLEVPHSRERLGFACPAELFAYLEAQMALGTGQETEAGDTTGASQEVRDDRDK